MDVIPLSPVLEDLRMRAAQVRESHDPEGPHGLRVACRRLDVWLRLGGWRVLRDDLRWLRTVAGTVRDVDVVRHAGERSPEAPPLHERQRAHVALVEALGSSRFAGLEMALAGFAPTRARDARRRTSSLVRTALARDPGSAAELHELRRRMRRVRYALEWLGEPIGPLPRLQDALGEVSDGLLLGRRVGRADLDLGRTVREAAEDFLRGWS
jgi:CHAD domain-containing protein